MDQEIEILKQYIRNETGHTGPIKPDDDLLKTGLLDSFSIVSLAMFAQEHFGVEFEGDDLVRENLASLSSLVALIRRRSTSE
ncbi:acyl carrier protein [Accumulibacter sp.]|uniref:acyl carrier protein n=1 Tax=Accumulibacter sp. TaxID=2053492 RepID=UPI001A57028E|nr:acyl carrier protein [Accumulibacter sp.]MBL8373948.1 acyl carrier protein [Accumulibacter sp.]